MIPFRIGWNHLLSNGVLLSIQQSTFLILLNMF